MLKRQVETKFNTLFPQEFIAGSVNSQEQLSAALAKYSNLSKAFVGIALLKNDIRQWYERYWPRVYKYLDIDFASRFQLENEHESRAWEFYIASVLVDQGLNIREKTWDTGPDFCIISQDGKNVWIEAVACSSGETDPVPPKPEMRPGEIFGQTRGIEEAQRPLVLRITNVISKKFKQYKNYLENPKCEVKNDDCFIIAVSGAAIEWATDSEELIKRALFGKGLNMFVLNPDNHELVGPFYKPAPQVIKQSKSGEECIPTNIMESEEFSDISAVIYCGMHAYDRRSDIKEPSDAFLFAYHSNPKNPIPDEFFKFGHSIRKNLQNSFIEQRHQGLDW